jgi:hypothetical protein
MRIAGRHQCPPGDGHEASAMAITESSQIRRSSRRQPAALPIIPGWCSADTVLRLGADALVLCT